MSSTEENKENVDAEKSDKTDGKSETPKQEKTPRKSKASKRGEYDKSDVLL